MRRASPGTLLFVAAGRRSVSTSAQDDEMAVGIVGADTVAAAQGSLQRTPDQSELQIDTARRVAHIRQGQRLGALRRRQGSQSLADTGQTLAEGGRAEFKNPADLFAVQAVQGEHRHAPGGRRQTSEQGGGRRALLLQRIHVAIRSMRLHNMPFYGRRFATTPTNRTARTKRGLIADHAGKPRGIIGYDIASAGLQCRQQAVLNEIVDVFGLARETTRLQAVAISATVRFSLDALV
jgi:hypothetical protein